MSVGSKPKHPETHAGHQNSTSCLFIIVMNDIHRAIQDGVRVGLHYLNMNHVRRKLISSIDLYTPILPTSNTLCGPILQYIKKRYTYFGMKLNSTA